MGRRVCEKDRYPQFINGYNYWMGGADRADQLVAAYTMKHRCRRTWVPFLMYIINIVRVNSYTSHRELKGRQNHMEFTLDFAQPLFPRRLDAPLIRKRQKEEALATLGPEKRTTHSRIRSGPGLLPPARLLEPELHVPTSSSARLRCFFCRYLAFHAKKAGKEVKQPCSTVKVCLKCNALPLCKHCFPVYHSKDSENVRN